MKWKTVAKLVGDDADQHLNQLTTDRWMIKSVSPLPLHDLAYVLIVACQSPEYEQKGGRKGRDGKKKASE